MRIRSAYRFAGFALVALPAATASADPFSFVDWNLGSATTSSISGTIPTTQGPVTATLLGGFTSVYLDDVYQPATSFVGGIVGNVPDIKYNVRIDNATTFTLNFSKPVTNLAYDLWSVGAPGTPVSYVFTQPFTLVASGPNARYGGAGVTKTGNTVSGEEGNGTLLFTGTYSSITWNVVGNEGYQAFTIGLSNTQPEPACLSGGLIAATALLRRVRRTPRPSAVTRF